MTGSSDLLAAALNYAADRHWTILPIGANKKPTCRWKRYQSEPPTAAQLRTWFTRPHVCGMAMLPGTASGGVIVRDFDRRDAFDRWRAEHADLAARLPQAWTPRGGHVYFRHDRDVYWELGDGELRGDAGHYVITPPSLHPSGERYRWMVPLPDGPVPMVDDLAAAGFIPAGADLATESPECTETCSPYMTSVVSVSSVDSVDSVTSANTRIRTVEDAIAASLPTAHGQRNGMVFQLARALKALPHLRDAAPADLKPAVRQWHKAALPNIGTLDFDDTWADFLRAWLVVKFPMGEDSMAHIVERTVKAELPACAMQYESDRVRFLVALCAQLQRAAGEGPFYLACRTAGQLISVDHVRASRYLNMLAADKVLSIDTPGTTKRATRYRYCGESVKG